MLFRFQALKMSEITQSGWTNAQLAKQQHQQCRNWVYGRASCRQPGTDHCGRVRLSARSV